MVQKFVQINDTIPIQISNLEELFNFGIIGRFSNALEQTYNVVGIQRTLSVSQFGVLLKEIRHGLPIQMSVRSTFDGGRVVIGVVVALGAVGAIGNCVCWLVGTTRPPY